MDQEHLPNDLEERSKTTLPDVVHYPVMYSSRVDSPNVEISEKQRVAEIVGKIDSLQMGDYWGARDGEMGRLDNYYSQVARLFGVDMRAIGTTRTQLMRTVMVTNTMFQEDLFDNSAQESDPNGAVFFEKGKRSLPGHPEILYSATYRPKINDFLRVGFSVLKVQKEDEFGPWEVDYPVFTLPSDVLGKMADWQESVGHGRDLDKNPLLNKGATIISRRVHDWFHSAILYDTNSKTSSFQEWSDDIFFTKHLFDEKGMINYEFLANYTHFLVWQQNFKDDPQAKVEILKEASDYLDQVGQFTDWMKTSGDPDSEKMRVSLSYVGTRALFDIIPFDDPDLQSLPMYKEVLDLLPEKERKYLSGMYTFDDQLPFSPTNEKITVKEVFKRYFQALKDEERVNRLSKLVDHITKDAPDAKLGDVSLAQEHMFLPRPIKDQLNEINPADIDPSVFRLINREFRRINAEAGPDVAKVLGNLVEVDDNGFFYLKIEPTDIEFDNAKEVIHTKGALLLQVPHDYSENIDLALVRSATVLSSQIGATYSVKPGEVIIFNTQNEFLAEKLIKDSTNEAGVLDVKKFLDLVQDEVKNGISDLRDTYPYDIQKAIDAFGLREKGALTDVGGNPHGEIISGFYKTVGRRRLAVKANGPMSVLNPSGSRWAILQGAILEDRSSDGTLDRFPSQGYNFNHNYLGKKWEDLPVFRLSSTFLQRAMRLADIDAYGIDIKLNDLQSNTEKLLHVLDNVNKIRLSGATPTGLITQAKTFADLE